MFLVAGTNRPIDYELCTAKYMEPTLIHISLLSAMNSKKMVSLMLEYGADLHHHDEEGLINAVNVHTFVWAIIVLASAPSPIV